MPAARKWVMKCTGISLESDGRQRVLMSKPADPPTGKTSGGATVVKNADAELSVVTEAGESYSVGAEYTVAVTG